MCQTSPLYISLKTHRLLWEGHSSQYQHLHVAPLRMMRAAFLSFPDAEKNYREKLKKKNKINIYILSVKPNDSMQDMNASPVVK